MKNENFDYNPEVIPEALSDRIKFANALESFPLTKGEEKPKKALFWKQPYGTAMFCGKRYESRTWRTNFRGLILVCTSLKPYEFKRVLEVSGYEQYRRINCAIEGDKTRNLHGFAIGVVNMVDCFPMKAEHENEAFVKYDPDLFIWKMENPRPIKPFVLKGQMGFMNLTPEIIAKIEYI